jgi:hypothetical protein
MENISSILRYYFLFIFILISLLVSGCNYSRLPSEVSSLGSQKTEFGQYSHLPDNYDLSWLIPGETSEGEVMERIGLPIEMYRCQDHLIKWIRYESSSEVNIESCDQPYAIYRYTQEYQNEKCQNPGMYLLHEIHFKDQQVSWIIIDQPHEPCAEGKKIKKIVEEIGKPEDVSWSWYGGNTRALLYCERGKIHHANSITGIQLTFLFEPMSTEQCKQEFLFYLPAVDPGLEYDDYGAKDPWGYTMPENLPEGIIQIWPQPDEEIPLWGYNKYIARNKWERGIGVHMNLLDLSETDPGSEIDIGTIRNASTLYVDGHKLSDKVLTVDEDQFGRKTYRLYWVPELRAGFHRVRFEFEDGEGNIIAYGWGFELTED